MTRRLVIMVKEPVPGRVKTRLAKGIGQTAAVWWYRHQLKRLLRSFRRAPFRVHLAVSPDHSGMVSRFWPGHFDRIPQGQGNLGDRMQRILAAFPTDPTIIIGSDIPDLTPRDIKAAFDILDGSDAVLGPAPDGGYWLIGAKGAVRPNLQDIRWSSEHTLSDTVRNLRGRIGYTSTRADVDEASDL